MRFRIYKTNFLEFIFIVHSSSANSGPTMNIEEKLLIANHLVQLDMDITQNQLAIALNQRRRRRWSMHPWLQRQTLYWQYERLMSEFEVEDHAAFKNFVRVEPAMSRELLNRFGQAISKNDTFYRKALHPGLRLANTLRCLATGDSYHSVMYGFRVADNTISCIVHEVCTTIIEEYQEEVISCPHHTPRMDSDSRSVQSEMAVPSCLGRPVWKTCSHLTSPKRRLSVLQLQEISFDCCAGSHRCRLQVHLG